MFLIKHCSSTNLFKMHLFTGMQSTRISVMKHISRNIFTTCTRYNISRQSKFMDKLIKRGQLKRESVEDINNFSYEAPKKQLSIHTQRRMNVLNKIFMQHITDMMSTGEIESEILNRGIEISHVKVTPDFKLINVYWIQSNTEYSDTNELLKKCAFQLRHELSQLRVIGNVPPIQFVKAKGIHMLKEVEQKLKIINLEENYVLSPYPYAKHHTINATTTCNDSENVENLKNDFSVKIPVMKHDVFGLNHFRIMSKIKASLCKSKKSLNQRITKAEAELDSSHTPKLNEQYIQSLLTDNKQHEQFTKFINQRRKEQRLRLKGKYSKQYSNICNFQKQNDVDSTDDDSSDDDDDGEIVFDPDYDDDYDYGTERYHK